MNFTLPALNASMNAACFVCLCTGLALIKLGHKKAHERAMLAATLFGALFLVGYVYYHFVVQPVIGPTKWNGLGWTRPAYFTLLISHVLLAVVNVPLVVMTLRRAKRAEWERHKRMARITFPVWVYVSLTGILVYVVLYHWNPPPG